MTSEQNRDFVFLQQLDAALPADSQLRSLLRRVKMDLNELLWTVKPELPQIGDSPELRQLRAIARRSPPAPSLSRRKARAGNDEELADGLVASLASSPHILIFSMRSWRIHKIWEGIIGRALIERGATVSAVVCDGLPRCDIFKLDSAGYAAAPCRSCAMFTEQTLSLFGLPVETISDFLTPADRSEARQSVAGWTGDYESFVAEGLPLGELVRPSMMRTLLRGSLEADDLTLRLYREYLEGAVLLARAFRRMLERHRPDTLIVMNGMFFAERIALAIAAQSGLHVVTHERGFMRNRLVLDHDRPANLFRVDEAWEEWKDVALTATEEQELDTYLQGRQSGKSEVVNYWPSVEARQEFIIEQLDLDPQKPILSMFTNILWDTAVYRRDRGFAGMFAWLKDTIDDVAGIPDLQLVLRIHPAEVRLTQKTRERVADRLAQLYPTLPPNVAVVSADSDISSYALIDLSTAVAVYTSTVGLEASLRNVPVLVAGETHYRDKGFTFDVETPEQYAAWLHEVPTWSRLSPDKVELARRYASIFFLRNMLPIDLAAEQNDLTVRLNFDTFEALKPGQNTVLDHVCTAILTRKTFPLAAQTV
jgi:hypothetical protein